MPEILRATKDIESSIREGTYYVDNKQSIIKFTMLWLGDFIRIRYESSKHNFAYNYLIANLLYPAEFWQMDSLHFILSKFDNQFYNFTNLNVCDITLLYSIGLVLPIPVSMWVESTEKAIGRKR